MQPETKTEDDDDGEFDEARAKAKIAKVNSEAAALRARLKTAEAKAAKLDEIENAGKPEIETLKSKLAEAERTAQEAVSRALRAEVAASKGLTAAQAKRLVGGSLEELEADADELLESFKPQEGNGGKPPISGRPTEQLQSGGDPTTEPEVLDPAKLAEQVSRGW